MTPIRFRREQYSRWLKRLRRQQEANNERSGGFEAWEELTDCQPEAIKRP
jgi:hypothetical protein